MTLLLLAGRRLLASIPTLLLILVGLFLLLQLAPGDTVDALMAQMGGGDPAQMEKLRSFYGLDAPVAVQLGRYLWRLIRFDLGFSAIYGQPVVTVIADRLPVTLLLMASSLGLSFAGGTALGILAARHVDRWPDTLISTAGLLFYAMPSFWFGLMGVVLFAVHLGWLPANGFEQIGAGLTGLDRGPRHRAAHGAADSHAVADLPGHLPARHARRDAGGDVARLRPHRARQGAGRDRDRDPPRAAQRAAADRHPGGAAGRHAARRFRGGRKRVRLPGPRSAGLRERWCSATSTCCSASCSSPRCWSSPSTSSSTCSTPVSTRASLSGRALRWTCSASIYAARRRSLGAAARAGRGRRCGRPGAASSTRTTRFGLAGRPLQWPGDNPRFPARH